MDNGTGSIFAARRDWGIFESQVDNLHAAARAKAAIVRRAWREAEPGDDRIPHPKDVAIVLSYSRSSQRAAGGVSIQVRCAGLEYTDIEIVTCERRVQRDLVCVALIKVLGFNPETEVLALELGVQPSVPEPSPALLAAIDALDE